MKAHEEQFSRYDTADYLQSEEEIAAYLEAVMEEGDPALIAAALGDIAKARNISQLARDVGMSREGLYKALSGEGNPTFFDHHQGCQSARTKIFFTSNPPYLMGCPWDSCILTNSMRPQRLVISDQCHFPK